MQIDFQALSRVLRGHVTERFSIYSIHNGIYSTLYQLTSIYMTYMQE
jgi:hypothetical protein